MVQIHFRKYAITTSNTEPKSYAALLMATGSDVKCSNYYLLKCSPGIRCCEGGNARYVVTTDLIPTK